MGAEGDEKSLVVCELFHSIQGESSRAGLPCFFIRLAGCNLHCTYCDTRYACETGGEPRTVTDLLQEAARYPDSLVELTGGEPLLQDNAYPLLQRLADAGRTVLVETNGSIDVGRVPAGVVRIVDLNCPSSGMTDRMDFGNLERLTRHDEVKFVIGDRADYLWARDLVREKKLVGRHHLLFSAVAGKLEPALLAGWILEDRLSVRLQLQLHRILWPAVARGV